MVNTLLFDVDGTLLDTTEFIFQATEDTLRSHGFAVPPRAEIASHVGKNFADLYEALCGLKDNQHLLDAHRRFQLEHMDLAVPFPGTLRTLRILNERGFKMAAVTSRSKITSVKSLECTGIAPFMRAVVSLEDVSEIKPHPAPLIRALELLQVEPEKAVMVGDSNFDIEAGRNAGTKTVRALYGFHTNDLDNPAPDFWIRNIGEILWLNF